jgi:RND family efflux transporter MFP subunit
MKTSAAILLSIALSLIACGCGPDDPPPPARVAVTVRTLNERETSHTGAYTASFQPYQQVAVAFQVSGYVNSITQVTGADGHPRDIQDGDHVAAREFLASVKSDTYQEQVNEAASALTSARAAYGRSQNDFQRDSELMNQHVIAAATFDQASQQYQTARAQVQQSQDALHQAQINLGYCRLSSPIDGVLLDRHIEIGSLVETSTVAFDVATMEQMKAIFGVSDIEVDRLKQGSIQTLATEAMPGVVLTGRITRIAANADPSTRTFDVEVTVPNKDGRLRSGMIASLQMATDGSAATAEALTLPINSIVRPPDDPKGFAVYVVTDRDGRTLASLRKVSLGEIIGNEIAVSKGVATGDRIIVRGATMVSEGTEVRIIP